MGNGFIVCECRKISGKPLSSLSSLYHSSDNSSDLFFIFFFAVLFIEDTMLLIYQPDATEAIMTEMAHLGIPYISRIAAEDRKAYMICFIRDDTLIA